MAATRLGWWQKLAALSPTIAKLPLPTDEPYWDQATNQPINAVAFNLSGCPDHDAAIARWIEGMAGEGVPPAQLEKMLVDLTSRNTYGSFSELAAYGLLIDSGIEFKIQVPMSGKAILNPNGSDLDGELTVGKSVYFDVKSFGLHEYLSGELNRKLSAVFSPKFVAIEGSADVGVDELSGLLGKDFAALRAELTTAAKATRGALEIKLQAPRAVQFRTQTANPYELAENHADYAFRFAKQFVRRSPFILVFVYHPWLGGFRLSTNFANDTARFTRSLARRTFMQFRTDRAKLFGVTRAAASRLVSGVMFVDAWQQSGERERSNFLYLNPYAKNPVSRLSRDHLVMRISNLTYDGFEHDAY